MNEQFMSTIVGCATNIETSTFFWSRAIQRQLTVLSLVSDASNIVWWFPFVVRTHDFGWQTQTLLNNDEWNRVVYGSTKKWNDTTLFTLWVDGKWQQVLLMTVHCTYSYTTHRVEVAIAQLRDFLWNWRSLSMSFWHYERRTLGTPQPLMSCM